jgi:hypothetical protein
VQVVHVHDGDNRALPSGVADLVRRMAVRAGTSAVNWIMPVSAIIQGGTGRVGQPFREHAVAGWCMAGRAHAPRVAYS